MVSIRPLDAQSAPVWDRFVRDLPAATFFHLSGWARVIQTAFGHRTYYVYAEQDGAITGVLPLAHVNTMLFGSSLISAPFCVYGGIAAAEGESAAALEAHAVDLMQRIGVRVMEFRFRDPVANFRPALNGEALDGSGALSAQPLCKEREARRSNPMRDHGSPALSPGAANAGAPAGAASEWVERPGLYVSFRKPIDSDNDKNMKAIPRKQRAMVRKGIQNQLSSALSRDSTVLHRVYAESVRNLGTPFFSRRYFRLLLDVFGDCSDVLTVLDQDTPIASVLNFYFRDEVLPYYGGGTATARHRAGNDFMYWEVMRRAAERGCALFDFGRSKLGTGAYAFKKNWGFEPAPLHYRCMLAPGEKVPDLNPLNPKYRLFIAGWKRLPLSVANVLGPPIVRGLG